MMMMHQQVGHKRGANSYAPSFRPMQHYQPHQVLPLSGYNYQQPSLGGYVGPVQSFGHQFMPQPPFYANPFYNPVETYFLGAFGTWPFLEPQLSYQAPSFMPNVGSSSGGAAALLKADIVRQIEYYFSDENLNKPDRYLISLMDDKGWVSVSSIAEFRRVKAICKSVTFILESLLDSSTVEVRGNKIRRRGVWSKWVSSSAK